MAFAPKTWQNLPAVTTPIDATGLIDLETRLSGYTDSTVGGVLVAPPSGDSSGATDGAAITAAFATLTAQHNGKGRIVFQAGAYYDNTQRTVGNYQIITGASGVSAGAQPGTLISYTGTAASYLNAQSTVGAQIRDIMIFANNAGFTGTVIDFSNASSLPRVEKCYIGSADTTTAVLINLDNSQDVIISGNNIVGGKYGIQGITTGGHFANGVTVMGNRIGGQGSAGACIIGMGTGWLVNAIFERQSGQRAIAAGPTPTQGSSIVGSWFGDGVGATAIMEVFANGLDIRGNYIGGTSTSTAVKFTGTSDGVAIVGNRFDTHSLGINKNAQTATAMIGPNSYSGVTTHHNFTAGGTLYVEA